MSKHIKYISSEHFGAPVMKGDRWGYCVEMLRKCLVEGFNERTDLNKVEIKSAFTIEISFVTEHNYKEQQTLKLSNISYPELNNEVLVTEVKGLTLTCKTFIDLTPLIGQVLNGITAKSIVAPLGMIEKFKDGNRSVFTTDEEKAFFYIDDEPNTKAPTGSILFPLVYMCSSMTDINTAKGNIFPFDTTNPTRYKTKDYNAVSGADSSGILNWITFGTTIASNSANSPVEQQIPIKYNIIGNGRMFYFMPIVKATIQSRINNSASFIYAFGKINTDIKTSINPYILIGSQYRQNQSVYDYNRVFYPSSVPPLSNMNVVYSNASGASTGIQTDIGAVFSGLLSLNGQSTAIKFFQGNAVNVYTDSILVSGDGVKTGNYPNPYTKKYYISKTNIFDNNLNKIGCMSGLMWSQNASILFMPNGGVNKFKHNGKDKLLYTYSDLMNTSAALALNQNTTSRFTYHISLDYEDWRNYD